MQKNKIALPKIGGGEQKYMTQSMGKNAKGTEEVNEMS